jgi:chromosome segregation ATPase
LEEDKTRLISELEAIRLQYDQLASEDENRQRTFQHQEEALVKAQNELHEIMKRNRILRKKLQSSGLPAAIDPKSEAPEVPPPPCASCTDLRQKLDSLQLKFTKLSSETSSFQNSIGSLDTILASFFEKLTEIGTMLQNQVLDQEMEQVRQLIARDDAVISTKVSFIMKFTLSLIESIIFNLKRRSGETAEVKLLKASITQLERKIADLQSENTQKTEELNHLQAELSTSRKTKERYETELASMTRSLTSLKSRPGPTDDGSSRVESESRSVVRTERRARATALSDSLALLDLLCQ